MILHTYFNKNNTILSGEHINTARNPIIELYYGDGVYSRYLFHFDDEKLIDLHENGFYPELGKMKHVLKMTNTTLFDKSLLNDTVCDDKIRTTSFDLIVFKLNQEWDEGTGYDYDSTPFLGESTLNDVNIKTPSNWYNATSLNTWSGGSGTFTGSSATIVGQQHFDLGNENLEIDLTDAINSIISGETNYGFGIAFARVYEETNPVNSQYVGFFSRLTQTFFEPFIETTYSEHITDDRQNFYKDKHNKLYLYVNVGNNPTDLDVIPSVVVQDNTEAILSAYTGSQVTHVSKGIYSIDIFVPSSGYTDCVMFYDTWSDISINGVSRADIELDFTLMDSLGYYNVGVDDFMPEKFGLSVHGIQREEKIVRGDIRKILVSARVPYTTNQRKTIDGLEYRLYIKEGPNEYTVMGYEAVEMAFTHNYFLLDTGSLIPTTYYLDIKLKNNLGVETYKDTISFDIVGIVNDDVSS